MSVKRIAVIFDNSLRPETTGLYCRRALGNLVEVEHYLPEELERIPPGAFDLFLNVDDGLNYRLPDSLRPAAYWAIDTHIEFERSRKKAECFDFVFTAQKDGAENLRKAGIDNAVWLPLACDPVIHRPYETKKIHDVCFVGNLFPGPRSELLEQIREHFPNTFVGRRYFEQMAETYSTSRIVFNCSVENDINMRVFEALACGSLLVTNDLAGNGQEELFEDGRHLAIYTDAEELLDTIEFYLKHEKPREQLALAGCTEVLSRHTYLHRMVQLLKRTEEGLSASSVALPQWGPVRTLQAVSSPSSREQPQVSACLLSWKRPENLRKIIEQLRNEPLIDDIVVWNNNPELRLNLDAENLTVINSERNLVTYGRYLCTQHARHDLIYTQDDDCLVHNIGELYISFQRDPSCITHGLKLGHLAHNAENFFDVSPKDVSLLDSDEQQSGADDPSRKPQTQGGSAAQMGLVGWGAFFNRKWCDVFQNYIACFGEDELLCRKADRLFTLLLDRRHRSLPAEVTDLEGASGEEALSVKSDHFDLTRQAVERALYLLRTTKPLNERTEIAEKKSESASENVGFIGATAAGAKDRSYFEFARPELLALVPENAKRVLDVGCGAGKLGQSIKQRQQSEVWGIERDEAAAALARDRLDQVLTGDAEQLDEEIEPTSFDCIICGDILEHLREPDQFLKQARNWLTDEGCLVASIPNVRHHSVVASLLAGNWTYESAGLLDQDHVRFFTRREIEKLFYRAGFRIDALRIVPGPGFEEWNRSGQPGEVQAGRLQIGGLSPEEAEEFYVYQYLVQAVPEKQPDYGLTSIMIPAHNQLAYTKQCIDSIRQFTDEPYELIVVDNGSTDGTPEYLQTLGEVTLITNTDNRGFPAAVNQGIKAAQGKQILLLNNDTIVTTGWLRRLLEVLHSDANIGLVGPVSNNVSGYQQIPVDYQDLAELDGFAWSRQCWFLPAAAREARLTDVDRLIGFCLLIKREVIENIGLFDEQFGIGNFEDNDFCRRAGRAGYRLVIAQDAFVHHFGSTTFRATGVDFAALLQENQRKYEQKWREETPPTANAALSIPTKPPRPQWLLGESDSGGLLLNENTIKLSLCMIVRDNENTIEPCLKSIRPWVDEIVVVDTGSKDHTPEICKRYGARLFHFPWCDDFSAARNESFRHARGEWLFWMDSDDTIPEECGRKLRELVDGKHEPNTLGYIIQVHCPASPSGGLCLRQQQSQPNSSDVTVVDHVKLVRNRPEITFEHRIHEQLLPAIRRAGGEVAWTDLYVVHSGSDHSAEGRQRKLDRDYRILKLDLEERPDHPFVLFNLGMTYADDDKHEQAIGFLKRCLEVSNPQESHLRKAYALLVSSYCQANRHEEGWETCQQGLQLTPDDKELLFRSAMLHHHFGRLPEAERDYLRVLNETTERHFASLDAGINGYKARHNLAIVYDDLGELEKSAEQWRKVVGEQPDYRPGWRGLGELLLKQQKLEEAERLAEQLIKQHPLKTTGMQLQAKIALARGDAQVGQTLLEQAIQVAPDDPEPQHALAQWLFETGELVAAIPVLSELAELTPENPSVFHNLGTAYLQQKRYVKAAAAFKQSLALRPDSIETERLLSYALRQTVSPEQAVLPQEVTKH